MGSIYDVRRGAMLREGSVRTVAGTVPSVNIGALAAFLLTGAQQREVRGRSSEIPVATVAASLPAAPPLAPPSPVEPPPVPTPPPPPDLRPTPRALVSDTALFAPPPAAGAVGETGPPSGRAPAPWMRPTAWVAGGLAVGSAGLAVERRVAANDAYDRARSLLGPGNALTTSTDLPRYRSLTADGDAAVRASWISAGASVVLAAAAGLLGWGSVGAAPPAAAF